MNNSVNEINSQQYLKFLDFMSGKKFDLRTYPRDSHLAGMHLDTIVELAWRSWLASYETNNKVATGEVNV